MKEAKVENTSIKRAFVIAATPEGLDLTALGVPESLQNKRPSELYYPQVFNPLSRVCWGRMFHEELFIADLNDLKEVREAWLFAVRTFSERCTLEDLSPFTEKTDNSLNDALRLNLETRRRGLKRYFDNSRLFSVVRVVANSDKHTYTALYSGNLRIDVSVKVEMESRESLVALLRSKFLKMIPDGDGFSFNLLKNLSVKVSKITSKTAVISYTLETKAPYSMPSSRKTKKQRHDWFDKEFFNPMVRSQLLNSLAQRVKF